MPDWLIERRSTLWLLLAVVGVCAGFAWWKTRRRWLLAIAAIVFTIVAAFVLFDYLFESDREQIERKISEMAAAVAPRDFNKIFSHISSDFRYGSADKAMFRKWCDTTGRGRDVRDLKVWDFRTRDLSTQRRRAQVTFEFKVNLPGGGAAEYAFFHCDATFALDPDNQWRLWTFKVFPATGRDQSIAIPGLD